MTRSPRQATPKPGSTLIQGASLEHLRKQAKDLLRACRGGDPAAAARFHDALPAVAGLSGDRIVALGLRLHDAQSCLAREHGFASWLDLATYVQALPAGVGRAARLRRWLELVYAGDVTGHPGPARPAVAARMLADDPTLATGSPYLACAAGDEAALRRATAADPAWVNRAGGPLDLPPLVAVTHSSLVRLADHGARLDRCARHLLAAGADPDQGIGNRYPPASVAAPDAGRPLSALYGAAGSNRSARLTRSLLEAGADPDDGESLYHSLEDPECTLLLLQKGARVTGTNAMYRALDLPDPAALGMLLAHGGDASEPARNPPLTDWGSPLLWAIRRRRPRHAEMLLAAGADPSARTPRGVSAWRLALQYGLSELAERLERMAGPEPLSDEERFVAACARADAAAAREIRSRRPDLPAALPEWQASLLPDMVAAGDDAAAMLMVELGWPIAVRGGDWNASALNLAVFRGDVRLTTFLLEHGASWREQQGYGSDVCGTLAWASCNEPVATGAPTDAPTADWVGCARALLAHGMPRPAPDGTDAGTVLIDGRRMCFSEEVSEFLLGPENGTT